MISASEEEQFPLEHPQIKALWEVQSERDASSLNTCVICGLGEMSRIHWRDTPGYHRFQNRVENDHIEEEVTVQSGLEGHVPEEEDDLSPAERLGE